LALFGGRLNSSTFEAYGIIFAVELVLPLVDFEEVAFKIDFCEPFAEPASFN
jgi:hypothetical protein